MISSLIFCSFFVLRFVIQRKQNMKEFTSVKQWTGPLLLLHHRSDKQILSFTFCRNIVSEPGVDLEIRSFSSQIRWIFIEQFACQICWTILSLVFSFFNAYFDCLNVPDVNMFSPLDLVFSDDDADHPFRGSKINNRTKEESFQQQTNMEAIVSCLFKDHKQLSVRALAEKKLATITVGFW